MGFLYSWQIEGLEDFGQPLHDAIRPAASNC